MSSAGTVDRAALSKQAHHAIEALVQAALRPLRVELAAADSAYCADHLQNADASTAAEADWVKTRLETLGALELVARSAIQALRDLSEGTIPGTPLSSREEFRKLSDLEAREEALRPHAVAARNRRRFGTLA